jgi:hypothetical protein
MTKENLIEQLEGVKSVTSTVDIDKMIKLIELIEAPKATTLSRELIDELSKRIERCLDHNCDDLVDNENITFDINYGNVIEVDEACIDVYETMDHINAILEEFESEPEIDSAGFSIADAYNNSSFNDPFRNDITYRFEDEESHHCDDPGCNCSI